jgi:hypothetical protein
VPVAIAAAGALAVVVALARGDGEQPATPEEPAAARSESGDLIDVLSDVDLPDIDLSDVGADPAEDVPGPRYLIARVRPDKQVVLRNRPRGRKLGKLGQTTEFGSQRSLWVQRVHGDWFGAPVAELPNGQLAWIRDDRSRIEVYETRYSIVADTSAQLMELRYGDLVLERFRVSVGRPGSPTPLGSYSVTDGLAGEGVGPYYGCCVLALTGHQPNLPPDWIGGDRIAIHGTPGAVGGATSAGCLRAADRDLVGLFARVPLGAPVFIRA